MRALIPVLAVVLLAPAAAAQEDGCVQSNPCLLDVEVDESGISSISILNMTSGDWFILSVSSLDERPHSVTFASVRVDVEGYGFRDSAPFQVPAAGTYPLKDSPSGDQADLHVLAGDVVEAENSASSAAVSSSAASSSGKGTPAPGLALLVAALAAVVLVRRR